MRVKERGEEKEVRREEKDVWTERERERQELLYVEKRNEIDEEWWQHRWKDMLIGNDRRCKRCEDEKIRELASERNGNWNNRRKHGVRRITESSVTVMLGVMRYEDLWVMHYLGFKANCITHHQVNSPENKTRPRTNSDECLYLDIKARTHVQ